MIRILHIEDRIHPEMGYQVNFFAKYHNPDHEFYILTTDSFSIWKTENPADIIKNADKEFEAKYHVRILRNKALLDRKGKNNLWIRYLFKSIKTIQPDVIFTHGIENLSTLRILNSSKMMRKYTVVTDTHTLLNQFRDTTKFTLYLALLKFFVIRKINKYKIPVFFTTAENKEIAINKYGVKPENIYPCPIGTDFSEYYFSPEKRIEIRKFLNITEDETVILYAGKINHIKQPHLILDAIKSVENQIEKKTSIIFIGTKDKDYFEKYFQVQFINQEIKTFTLPPVKSSELYGYYSAADFAVFPKENSLSSLDVQACKLPLIMEEDQTNAERLKEGGLLYIKDDFKDLAEKILLLINDIHLRKELGEKGFDFVKNNYDYAKIIKNMEEVIEITHRKKFL